MGDAGLTMLYRGQTQTDVSQKSANAVDTERTLMDFMKPEKTQQRVAKELRPKNALITFFFFFYYILFFYCFCFSFFFHINIVKYVFEKTYAY